MRLAITLLAWTFLVGCPGVEPEEAVEPEVVEDAEVVEEAVEEETEP